MQRRALLQVGIASAALLALAGGGIALWQPGFSDGRLRGDARKLFQAVGEAVLEGLLPAAGAARETALTDWLTRLDATIAGLPPATRAELSQLLGLLTLGPTRQMLARLRPAWAVATVEQVQQALQGMRVSSSRLRQQAYHALRDLSVAAFFSGRESWALLGYPGPSDV